MISADGSLARGGAAVALCLTFAIHMLVVLAVAALFPDMAKLEVADPQESETRSLAVLTTRASAGRFLDEEASGDAGYLVDDSPPSPATTTLAEYLLMGLGILLGLLGSILINVGNNVQAVGMGMVEEQKKRAEQGGPPPTRRAKRIWTAGTITFVIGSVINFAAFAFASAAVLAPLEAIQFVSNLIFARYVTKVPVSQKMVVGSALIVLGTIGAVASGPMSVYSFSIPQLRSFWKSPTWVVYLIVAWALSLGLQVFWHMQMRKVKEGGTASGPPALMPIFYAVSSALIGTQSVVQAKCFSELVELWLSGETLVSITHRRRCRHHHHGLSITRYPTTACSQRDAAPPQRSMSPQIWVEWFTYAVLTYFLVTVGFWLYRLNAALGKYDPLFIIPLLQASYIVLATLAGGIYFQEFQTLEWWQLLLFFGCIGIMFGGLALLIPPITAETLAPAVDRGGETDGGKGGGEGGDSFGSGEEAGKEPVFTLRMTHTLSFANTTSFRTAVDQGQVSADLDGGGVRLSFRQGGSTAAFLGGTGLQSFKPGSQGQSCVRNASERSSARRPASAHPPLPTSATSNVAIEMPRLNQVKLDDLMHNSRRKMSDDI